MKDSWKGKKLPNSTKVQVVVTVLRTMEILYSDTRGALILNLMLTAFPVLLLLDYVSMLWTHGWYREKTFKKTLSNHLWALYGLMLLFLVCFEIYVSYGIYQELRSIQSLEKLALARLAKLLEEEENS